uniref:Uncharacterized protein n=1 Tax=Hyaloperonospora arabidopsidis (strain Emoy2) TaxID=559515 RepID=M4C4X0_HYAAE
MTTASHTTGKTPMSSSSAKLSLSTRRLRQVLTRWACHTGVTLTTRYGCPLKQWGLKMRHIIKDRHTRFEVDTGYAE